VLRSGTFALTALLSALTAIGPLSTDMYLPSLPSIANQLHGSTAQAQLTISSYLVGFALGQLIYGPVSDRRGRKPVLLAALGMFGIASFICTLATSVDMLIAARAVLIGSASGSRFGGRLGLDRIIGVGVTVQVAGGLLMIAALAFGLRSALSLVLPMAVYLGGLGLVLPHAIAGAMQPYRDRAGAASSLLGFLQQSAAALCGVVVGQLLGDSAWPMAIALGCTGAAAMALWATTRGLRRRALRGN
jgi:hypothetical protein